MPSRSVGKTIQKIKINKKNVVITFTDKSKLTCVGEVLANFYLYEGKTLDDKTLKDIKNFNASAALMKYALTLLKKSHYSEWKMREKLYAKEEGNKKDIDLVIKKLKEHDLINDKMLILDTIEYGNERNIGKNKILQELAQKGVFQENLTGINFSTSLEKKKANNNLPKLEKKYAKYSYEQKKQRIYRSLLSLGFDSDIALAVLSNIKQPSYKEEHNKLEKDFEKVYIISKRKYDGQELKNKVITSLRTKGYKLNEILKVWESNYGENDF